MEEDYELIPPSLIFKQAYCPKQSLNHHVRYFLALWTLKSIVYSVHRFANRISVVGLSKKHYHPCH